MTSIRLLEDEAARSRDKIKTVVRLSPAEPDVDGCFCRLVGQRRHDEHHQYARNRSPPPVFTPPADQVPVRAELQLGPQLSFGRMSADNGLMTTAGRAGKTEKLTPAGSRANR